MRHTFTGRPDARSLARSLPRQLPSRFGSRLSHINTHSSCTRMSRPCTECTPLACPLRLTVSSPALLWARTHTHTHANTHRRTYVHTYIHTCSDAAASVTSCHDRHEGVAAAGAAMRTPPHGSTSEWRNRRERERETEREREREEEARTTTKKQPGKIERNEESKTGRARVGMTWLARERRNLSANTQTDHWQVKRRGTNFAGAQRRCIERQRHTHPSPQESTHSLLQSPKHLLVTLHFFCISVRTSYIYTHVQVCTRERLHACIHASRCARAGAPVAPAVLGPDIRRACAS
eukprot:GHVU01193466.1.p1 GENE.GHVU01193466.1~~GHVU01193466.1.p1  ORF type:complete len:292 (-),score=2.61 GHVU01193466.1:133-1008(-)